MIIREKITHQEIEEFYGFKTSIDFGTLIFKKIWISEVEDEERLKLLFFKITMTRISQIRKKLGISDMAVITMGSLHIVPYAQSYIFHSDIGFDIIFEFEIEGEHIRLNHNDSEKYKLQLF